MCLCAGEKAQTSETSDSSPQNSPELMRSAWNSSVDAPSGSRLLSTELWSFPPASWIICLPWAQELIINPVALLQIYCAPSELQVTNCRTYGAFQLFTPWNGAAGVRVSPLGWQRAKQTAVLLKPASRVGAVAAFSPPTARFSSPLSSEHLSKHITGSRVSTAAARPRRSLRVLTQCLLRCPYPGHRADRPLLCEVCVCVKCVCVCVCLSSGVVLSLFRLSGWLSDGHNRRTQKAPSTWHAAHTLHTAGQMRIS